eukprot:350593-Chlamydomonas_euryale.AAC.12
MGQLRLRWGGHAAAAGECLAGWTAGRAHVRGYRWTAHGCTRRPPAVQCPPPLTSSLPLLTSNPPSPKE